MTKFLLPLALILVAIIAFSFGGRFSSSSSSTAPRVVAASQAEVDVQVSYLGDFKFEVALNTHSVDLSGFDFSKSVSIKTKNSELNAISAVPVSDSPPHHRAFTLTFPKFNLPITLLIKDLGGIPERQLVFERG